MPLITTGANTPQNNAPSAGSAFWMGVLSGLAVWGITAVVEKRWQCKGKRR